MSPFAPPPLARAGMLRCVLLLANKMTVPLSAPCPFIRPLYPPPCPFIRPPLSAPANTTFNRPVKMKHLMLLALVAFVCGGASSCQSTPEPRKHSSSSAGPVSMERLLRMGHELMTEDDFLAFAKHPGIYEQVRAGRLVDWSTAGNTPLPADKKMELGFENEWGEYAIFVTDSRYLYFATDRRIPLDEVRRMIESDTPPEWRIMMVACHDHEVGLWRQTLD